MKSKIKIIDIKLNVITIFIIFKNLLTCVYFYFFSVLSLNLYFNAFCSHLLKKGLQT